MNRTTTLLDDLLETSARTRPQHTALVCSGARLSYADVEMKSNRLARGLQALGVRRGDRVAVCLDNSIEHVVSLLAVWKAGAVAMLVNPTTKSDKLAHLLTDAEAASLIVSSFKLETVADVLGRAPHLRSLVVAGDAANSQFAFTGPTARLDGLTGLMEDGDVTPPKKTHIDQDLAVLLYTSGSSGTPKGVMLTHQSLRAVTTSITSYLELAGHDVVLQVLPLSFGYGLTQLLTTFSVGATLVLERSFAFPQVILQRLAAERATTFAMVPTIASVFASTDLSMHDLSSLRRLTNAGAALPNELAKRLREKLPNARLFPMYGQTECIRVTYLPPEEVEARPGSVGRGMPNQEVWLVDEEGRRLPPGSTGELVVRGTHLMRGYWKMPEATREKLRPGPFPGELVLHTGDLFHMDADGWLTFISRQDDIIKTRGEKVSPREVENVLFSLAGVAEVAVIGVPDVLLGQSVKAFVAVREGSLLDNKALQRHCAAHLEDFAIPKQIELVGELPKTSNGKIDKQALLNSDGNTK